MKRFISLLVTLLLTASLGLISLPAQAGADENGFTIVDGVLTAYSGPGGDITIPNNVTIIAENAFLNNKTIASVTIYSVSLVIEDTAFDGCNKSMVFICYWDSKANVYARKYGFKYENLPTYFVDFDSQGGTSVLSKLGKPGYTIDPPTTANTFQPTSREGYTFAGWFREPECISEWNFATDTVGYESFTLYAKWIPLPYYTVTFDSQGGSAVAPVSIMEGKTIGDGPRSTKENYIFRGWSKMPGCEVFDWATAWDCYTYKVTESITLYAIWSRNYTVTFDSRGGSDIGNATVMAGDPIQMIPTPVMRGFKFLGWYKDEDCSEAWNFVTDKVLCDITLYAKWAEGSGGSGNSDDSDDSDDDSGPTYIDGTIGLTDKESPHINLSAETIKVPFSVAAYSVDGGKKWKKGPLPTDAKLTRLFDKGLTLWVASRYNDKDIKDGKTVKQKKGVANSATVVMFPEIEKRPKANTEKLGAYYWSENPDTWVLCKKGSAEYTAPEGSYEWAETGDGKTPKGSWQEAEIPLMEETADHSGDGFKLKQSGEKSTYLFRSAATAEDAAYTPASKAFKVKPAAFNKVPTYKTPAVKKGTAVLKLKKGDLCMVGDKVYGSLTAATALNIVYEVTDPETEIPGGSKVTIWKAATGKKPRSIEQKNLTMPAIPKPEA